MRISKRQARRRRIVPLVGVLLVVMLTGVWFTQQSIERYWLVTYAQHSPLAPLGRFAWWRAGAYSYDWVQQQRDALVAQGQAWFDAWTVAMSNTVSDAQPLVEAEPQSKRIIESESKWIAVSKPESQPKRESESVSKQIPDSDAVVDMALGVSFIEGRRSGVGGEPDVATAPSWLREQALRLTEESMQLIPNAMQVLLMDAVVQILLTLPLSVCPTPTQLTLAAGDKVFFVGDSLMHSIAPHLQKRLKREYGIDSLNLSKSSTGLSYAGFFDWPQTVEDTLRQHPDVAVMLVFLGANDAQGFIDPARPRGAPLRFQSERWEAVYQARVTRILQAAKQAAVQVAWVGLPRMRPARYQQRMHYLNALLQRSVGDQALWLPTAPLLGDDAFHDTIKVNGARVRVRSKDGIHFSTDGEIYVADYIWSFIRYQAESQVQGGCVAP